MQKPLLLLLALTLLGSSNHESRRPGGKDYALFNAVEQYDNSAAWKKLPGLITEVEGIASDLRDLYGYTETYNAFDDPPSMVEVVGGKFMMGSESGDSGEKPDLS